MNRVESKKNLIREIGKAFIRYNELSYEEIKKLCNCTVNHNILANLVASNILVSTRGRYSKYKLNDGFKAFKLISNPELFINFKTNVNTTYIKRREASIYDYKNEIKRLKRLLDENGVSY
jgi:hypothetical protein